MNEKNMFENANFGDKFVTRGGRKCLIIEPPYKLNNVYRIDYIVQGESGIVSCNIDGHVTDVDSDWDIVSRYQEPLDHAELNAVIDSKCWDYENGEVTDISYRDFGLGFKEGYKYALNYDD